MRARTTHDQRLIWSLIAGTAVLLGLKNSPWWASTPVAALAFYATFRTLHLHTDHID